MLPQSLDEIQLAIPKVLAQMPPLRLLVLFGSRAKGNHTPNSDWDLAVLYDEAPHRQDEQDEWNWLRIESILQTELGLSDDQIDVVILNRCSDVLAHTIARDGKPLYEQKPGEFERFQAIALMSQAEQKAYIAQQRTEVRAALARWKS